MTGTNVTLTGILSNLRGRHDGGVDATLIHPEARVQVVFPYEVHLQCASLITAGARVTVHGEYAGMAIRVSTVEAAGR